MKFSTKQLSYEDILQYVSEEDIALFYLGATTKSTIYSLFREEDNPGKYLFWYNGRMRYNDWIVKLSLPDAIMAKNNWSYAEFMGDLLKNFHQTNTTIPKLKYVEIYPLKLSIRRLKLKLGGGKIMIWNFGEKEALLWIGLKIREEILNH